MARTAVSSAALGVALGPASKRQSPDEVRAAWLEAFRRVRRETEARAAPLSPEDQQIQSMADASPAKWHRAHVTWFFEQFLLKPNDPGYTVFDERFPFLFNSYYVAAGPRHARPQRGLITRPNGDDVTAYRAHVDAAVERLIGNVPAARRRARVFAFSKSACITSSSIRNCCSPTSCTPSRRIRPIRPMTPQWQPPAAARPTRLRRCAVAASNRSAMTARASASTTRRRAHDELIADVRIARQSGQQRASGSSSSPPAATRRRRSGCRTAGRRCRPKAGRRPATGGSDDGALARR